jgi:ADP-ribose pyrophosphatase YjhB (NUDIX family)
MPPLVPPPREYPDAPRVGVGAVVLDGDRVLLVQRGRAPSQGKWSVPGGLLDLGERLEDAVVREVEEECGLRVQVLGLCGVLDRIVHGDEPDADGRGLVRYHWVIIDYVAAVVGGTLQAGSDAAQARWVPLADLDRYDTTAGLASMIQRAVSLRDAFIQHAKR